MEFSKKNVKIILGIVTFGIILLTASQHLSIVISAWNTVLKIFAPLIVAFAIAFILNIPMTIIETKLLRFMTKSNKKIVRKLVRPISLISTLIFIFGLIILLLFIIIPQLSDSVTLIVEKVPQYYKSIILWVDELVVKYDLNFNTEVLNINFDKIISLANKHLTAEHTNTIVNMTFSVTSSVISGVANFFLGLIVSVYMLAEKEKILAFIKKFFGASLPEKIFNKSCHICQITSSSFSSFIGGQFTDAFVLGILCFVGMSIFKFPNAAVISVIIGVTALIPVIGPLIGEFIGCFIILMENPFKALLFLIFILILQAIDNNIIYPKVVGKSVGIPGILVLVSVIIGGNVGGLLGVLLGVPIASALYAIALDWVSTRKQAVESEETSTEQVVEENIEETTETK